MAGGAPVDRDGCCSTPGLWLGAAELCAGEWGLCTLGVIAVICAALRCLHRNISRHLHQENQLDPMCALSSAAFCELRTQALHADPSPGRAPSGCAWPPLHSCLGVVGSAPIAAHLAEHRAQLGSFSSLPTAVSQQWACDSVCHHLFTQLLPGVCSLPTPCARCTAGSRGAVGRTSMRGSGGICPLHPCCQPCSVAQGKHCKTIGDGCEMVQVLKMCTRLSIS